MKFRIIATSRDITIFILFAIFLLYIVALGVLNLPQLASEGTFYGLNPIEAFSSEYIGFTLVFYFIFLAGLFFSVSSYFFEFEQGFGIGFSSKNSSGYSSWAKPQDIKTDKNVKRVLASDPKSDYAGIPLVSNGKELWIDDGEFHNLVIGATGSGKTVNTILPTVKVLAKKGESLICTDPKGEIFEKTGGLLKQNGYNIILLNFRNPQNGNSWNPLSLPYKLYKNGNQDKAIELLDDLALNILYEENSANNDPFWEKTAADYFAGIALAMFEDAPEDEININSINMTATVGEDKFGGSTYIKEYFNYKDPSSAAYVNASGTVMAPSETKGGIISVFKQKVKLFASRENLSEMLSYSDFSLDSIGKVPTAVFIIIQDEKKTYHSLATIFIKQVYETLIDVAQSSGGKLPIRTNFLLDEFANMPPLKDVTTMITAARSRQIRFTMIIQNFAQLNKVYGKDDAETIKGNCGNIIYLISTELAALEEISKLCGEKKSKKDDKTASTPLATVSDLQRMKQFDQILLRMRKSPFKTSFVPDFKINWGGCVSPKVEYPVREKHEVKIFDIREFVKNKKNQKINEMMASMQSAGGAPFPPRTTGFRKDNQNNQYPDISVSDLVKKIDLKLAELEKEEQNQKANSKPTLMSKPTTKEMAGLENHHLIRNDKAEVLPIDEKSGFPIKNHDVEKTLEQNNKNINHEVIERNNRNNFGSIKNYSASKVNDKDDEIELLDDSITRVLSDTDSSLSSRKQSHDTKVSNEDIESKVNNQITRDVLSDVDEDFGLLTPIEAIDDKNTEEEKNSRLKMVEVLKKDMISSIEKEAVSSSKEEEHKMKSKQSVASSLLDDDTKKEENKIFKPTATIKLEDVSEDDKFFDDFFDD